MNRRAWPLWMLVLIWCLMILSFTLQPQFTSDSTLGAIERLAPPAVVQAPASGPATTPSVLAEVNHWLRRSAHVFLYAGLGALLVAALRATRSVRYPAILALVAAVGVASLDEWIQTLVPARTGRLHDVLLDGAAAMVAIAVITVALARRRPRRGILQAITLAETGGAQKVVFSLLRATEGEMPTTLVCGPGGDLVEWVRQDPATAGAQVIELGAVRRGKPSPLADLRTLWELMRIFARVRPEIVHLHSSKMGVLGRLAAWVTGVPFVIYTAHGWPVRDYHGSAAKSLYAWVERAASMLADVIVCVSESERRLAVQNRLAPTRKLQVILNGVPAAPQEHGHLRRLLDIGPDTPLIVAIGRLAHPKDPLSFIRLAASTRATLPEARFVWLGDGPLRSDCEAALHSEELSNRVIMPGNREDARALINDADIFVMLSHAEGLPLVVMEAMLAAKPVVAWNVGGIAEMVSHGRSGYLYEVGDLDGVARSLIELIDHETVRIRVGQAGLRWAEENLAEQRMNAEYLRLYHTRFTTQQKMG